MAKKKTGSDTPAAAAPRRRAPAPRPAGANAAGAPASAPPALDVGATIAAPEPVAVAADMDRGGMMGGDGESAAPSYEEIAEAAYHRYLRRGGGDGQDFDDWVEAERELRSRRR